MTSATQPSRSTAKGGTAEPFTGESGLSEPAPSDPVTLQLLRDEHVRQGFATLELYERLEPTRARKLANEHLQAQLDHAKAALPLLAPVPGSQASYKIMTTPTNQARLSRVLDFVMPGDRIFDVGLGYGYMACLLLRDSGMSAYIGIDLTESQIAATRAMVEVNGLTGAPMQLDVGDLYDLTPAIVVKHDPDLLLLLEVLEHVPDAELALATLARCMRDDAAILFSVPVLGRLEKVWGHVSLFDTARIKAMCEKAGLVIQHIEVVQNTWTFVLATPTPAMPRRLLYLLGRPLPAGPSPVVVRPMFNAIDPATVTTTGNATVTADEDGIRATVRQQRRRSWLRPKVQPEVGGLTFPVAGDVRLRLELSFDDSDRIQRVIVNLRDERGGGTARWVWTCGGGRAPKPDRQTYVLRPGRKLGPFAPVGTVVTGASRSAEVVIELAADAAEAAVILHRAAAAHVTAD
jgi:2-polyprenyl-3-methyl-5-hydroxy-6-metoxy-1,4-benzoquinol methylase